MFSTFCSIFVIFFCLNLVSSQENPVIRRKNDTHIHISMTSIDVDPGRNIDNVCNDYSVVYSCLNEQLDVTCPVNAHYFREKYGREYDFEGRMSIYKRTKNGLANLKEQYVESSELVNVRDEALQHVTNDPCYFCWFNAKMTLFSASRVYQQSSKAVKVQFYDCRWLNKIEKIYYAQPTGVNVNFTCWDAHFEESATIEWYLQIPTDDEFRLLSSSDTSNISNVYQINSILEGDIGLYKCYVWFRDSRVRFSRQFDLRFATPMKPTKFDITNISDTRVVLTFDENALNSKYVSNISENRQWFQIRYYDFEKSDINQSIKVTTNDTRANLTGLIPFTLYVAELRQLNIFGESEPIYKAFLTKDPTAVGRPFDVRVTAVLNEPVTLKCYNFENASRGIRWWVPETRDDTWRYQNAGRYVINNTESMHAGLYHCGKYFNEFPNLYHRFAIQLSIVMPPLEPKEFRCSTSKLGSLTLTWTSAAEEIKTEQDFFDRPLGGYKLKYKKITSAQNWSEKISSSNYTEMVVENLESQSYYSVRLSSFNQAGESDAIQKVCKVL